MHYIYKITDNLSGHYYVGKRCNSDPETDGYYGSGANRVCLSAKKHRGVGFTKEVLIFVADKTALSELERDFIGENYIGGAEHDPLCLNRKAGGEGGVGFAHSDIAREKMSECAKNRVVSAETRAKISESLLGNTHTLGHFLSEETKKKISESRKGIKFSEEHKKKISQSLKGKHNNQFGRKRSEETKKKMSESHKNRLRGAE